MSAYTTSGGNTGLRCDLVGCSRTFTPRKLNVGKSDLAVWMVRARACANGWDVADDVKRVDYCPSHKGGAS